MEKVVNNIIGFIILLGFSGICFAQETTPYLERKITLDLNGTTLKETLKLMETQGDYLFAYRTTLIQGNLQLTRSYTNKTTRTILNDLFAGKVTYKERGSYIILREQSTADEKTVLLSGYVSNKESGETIPYATLYDSTTLTSASSNAYGYYSLTVKNSENPLIIVKKKGYRDTTIQLAQSGTAVYNILLEALPVISDSVSETSESIKKNTEENAKINWFQRFVPTEEQKSKFNNFTKQLRRKTQVSLVPYIGTNGRLSGKTTVDYSFNILGGFNGGVRKLEIGGIYNLVWDSVSYCQIAGIFNKVGGYQRGAQFAGITNINKANVHGAQFAGISNNTSGSVIGAQAAGIVNSANGFTGAQFAGISNYSRKSSIGGQFAGIYNKSEDTIQGAQVAGIINIADRVDGAQVGFINVNNSIDGVPVGFFSFSKKGLHQLEISTNEIFQANLAFKTGVNQFYNSFIGGVRFDGSSNPAIGLGYGLGTSLGVSRKSRFFFDLQAMHIHQHKVSPFLRPNALGKISLSYQWQVTPLFAIAAGPSFNVLFTEEAWISGTSISTIAPYSFHTISDSEYRLQSWVGGLIALRFF